MKLDFSLLPFSNEVYPKETTLISGASVFVLHENKQPFLDTLKFFPHLQQHFRVDLNSTDSSTTIHSLDFLEAFHSSTVVLTPPQPGPLYERKLRTYNRELQAHKIWKEA